MSEIAIDKEKKRIYSILENANVSDNRIASLETIIEECAFMRHKLNVAKKDIRESSIVIPYDNGGNQRGIRENPLFKGYESLLKSYLLALDRIISVLPKEEQNELKKDNDNVLELVRSMHKEIV